MSGDSTKARRTLYLWALGLNVVAWGGYLVLTKVMGIDFNRFGKPDWLVEVPSPKIDLTGSTTALFRDARVTGQES